MKCLIPSSPSFVTAHQSNKQKIIRDLLNFIDQGSDWFSLKYQPIVNLFCMCSLLLCLLTKLGKHGSFYHANVKVVLPFTCFKKCDRRQFAPFRAMTSSKTYDVEIDYLRALSHYGVIASVRRKIGSRDRNLRANRSRAIEFCAATRIGKCSNFVALRPD